MAVFGLLKRNGKVYTAIIPDAKTETLMPIIQEKVKSHSIVYTDCFRAYNALDVSEFHHMRINHSELFADRYNHINGFGIRPSVICVSLTALKRTIFTGF